MTPLELLAVGVIVVLVWLSGAAFAANTHSHYGDDDHQPTLFAPVLIGVAMVTFAVTQLILLGIKEAAK